MWLSELTPEWRRLVCSMHRIGFGCIRNLIIRNGQPVFSPRPQIIREVKVGERKPVSLPQEFTLKQEVIELHAELSGMQNGTLLTLEVRHGLPFRYTLEECAA